MSIVTKQLYRHQLDFFVIGAQKCATSWLFYCLQDHPEILIPEKKIEIGYIGGRMFHDKGESWFFERFKAKLGAQIVGDVSVDYLYDLGSAETLRNYSMDPRFVVSLRHPVDRMISSYSWLVRRGRLPNLPVAKGLKPLLEEPTGFTREIPNGLEEVVRRSCYAAQLKAFLQVYDPKSILAILFEQIKSNPLASIQRVYQHLGVNASFHPPSINVKPKKNTYNRALLAFERMANTRIIAKSADLAHRFLNHFSIREQGPQLPPGMYGELCTRFAPEIAQTRDLLAGLPEGNRPDDQVLQTLWAK